MYSFVAFFIGCLIAGMVALNGGLSAQYGMFSAAVIIHLVGAVFAFLLLKIRRMKLGLRRDIPKWLFLGGAIGVCTTLFNNFSFGKIAMTSIVALSLLGQTLASLAVDCFGLFGMPRRPFRVWQLPGLACAAGGVLLMLDASQGASGLAVLLSLGAGITVVLSRSVNAGLAARIGALQSSFVNHVVGLFVTTAILLLFGRSEPLFAGAGLSPKLWIYLGGTMGVFVVMLFNLTVPRLPALRLSLFSFAGQVLMGAVVDALTREPYSPQSVWGGLLVAAGALIGMLLEHTLRKRETGAA